MKIIEKIDCPECSHEVDIVVEFNMVDTIGGCVGCDYMPTLFEVEEALDIEDLTGGEDYFVISEWR